MEQIEMGVGYDSCAFLNYDSSNDFTLYEIGRCKCKPNYSYGPAIRTRAVFHFVVSGKGSLVIEDKEYQICGPQGFLIPADVKAYYEADEEDPWEYMWLHLGGPKLLQVFNEAGLSADNPIFIPKDNVDLFSPIFEDLEKNMEKPYYCYGKFYEICDYLINYSSTREIVEADVRLAYVKKIVKYVQIKYCEPIQVSDIANACGLNRSYLTRIFKDATGYSIQNFLMSYRMKCAIDLLHNPDLSVQYISFAVGYGDVFTFSKAFKKIYGKSPSEYRLELDSNS